MEWMTLGELAELFRQANYADGTPLNVYLPFQTARDCPRGKGALWLWPLRENKVEWWSALVDWNLAARLHTRKYEGDMRMVRLGPERRHLRLEGVREDDVQYTNKDRNLARGALGKKIKNYWDLQARAGLKEVYEDLFRIMGSPEKCLRQETAHLRNTLFYSAWCKADPCSSSSGFSAADLSEEHCPRAEDYLSQLLSNQEGSGSLWMLAAERLVKLSCDAPVEERARWEELLEIVDSASEESQRLEILAALVLLALNAGELLRQPERHKRYEEAVIGALARRVARELEKKPEEPAKKTEERPARSTACEKKEDPKQAGTAKKAAGFGILPQELQWRILERRDSLRLELEAQKRTQQEVGGIGYGKDAT